MKQRVAAPNITVYKLLRRSAGSQASLGPDTQYSTPIGADMKMKQGQFPLMSDRRLASGQESVVQDAAAPLGVPLGLIRSSSGGELSVVNLLRVVIKLTQVYFALSPSRPSSLYNP